MAIAEMLPEPDQRLEDPELIRKQIRGIFEMLAGQPPTTELMQMVQGLKQNRTTKEKLKVADKLQLAQLDRLWRGYVDYFSAQV